MKKHTLPLFVVVSILAFIGGCAPTTNVQKASNDQEVALFSEADLNFQLDPLLNDLDQMSDQQKFSKAALLSTSGQIEASNKILSTINTKNLNNRYFVDFTLLAAENYSALLQMSLAANQLNQKRFRSLFKRQNNELKQQILELQAKVAIANGDHYQGLEKLISLGQMAKRKTNIRQIHDRIWAITSRMSYQKLNINKVKASTLSGWLNLAARSRSFQAHPDEQSYILSQ